MKILGNILFVVALILIIIGLLSKLTIGIMFQVKPISFIVASNTCLLIYLVIKSRGEKQ